MATAAPSMESSVVDLKKDIAGAKQDITKLDTQAQDTLTHAYGDYRTTTSTLADSFHKLQEEGANIKPFEPPKAEDPLKSYGASVAGLIAIVSGLTGKPMVDALNAGAAAINAQRANNTLEYDRAFDAWKTNTDFAFKRMTWENEQLGNILKLADSDRSAAEGQARALFALAQDRAGMVTLDTHGFDALYKLQDARIRGMEAMDNHTKVLLELNEQKQLQDALTNFRNPEAPGNKAPPNSGRTVNLKSLTFPTSELTGLGAAVEGLFTQRATGMAGEHVRSKEALEQLRQKTLDAFRASQVGRSLAMQMKAVDDIIPKWGLTTYPTLRENVKQTRDNLAGMVNDLIDDANSAYALKNKAKLTEDIIAINKARTVLRDYDAILADNPEGTSTPTEEAGKKDRPPLSSFFSQ